MTGRWEVFAPHYGRRCRLWARLVARLAGLDYDSAGTFVDEEHAGGAGDGD
jgi:hypothetical protein